MKRIEVKWIELKEENPLYDKEMRVTKSTHSRFKEGTRFDFGFLSIASDEGYVIEIHPA